MNPLTTARDSFAAAHPETRITVNGRDWGMIRAGATGPALVLIPGTLGRADIFWQQIAALQGQARIMALSYPGSGGIDAWAGDIAALIAAQGMQGATVLGSSLGGYLAQHLTAAHPGLVGGLVAANTLPSVAGLDQMMPYALDLWATPIDALRAGFTNGLSQWQTDGHPYGDLAGLLLTEVAGRIPEAEMRARLDALKTAGPLPPQVLGRDRVFTVESDDDHLIPPQVRAALRATLRPSRAFRFSAASHFPYVTRPDDYTALLREVLGLSAPHVHWPAGEETRL